MCFEQFVNDGKVLSRWMNQRFVIAFGAMHPNVCDQVGQYHTSIAPTQAFAHKVCCFFMLVQVFRSVW